MIDLNVSLEDTIEDIERKNFDSQEEYLYELKHREETYNRKSFLAKAEAIPTPVELYALWIELYVRQGGKVARAYDRDYAQTVYVNENLTAYAENSVTAPFSYEGISWGHWTPTRNGGSIPANYGSSSMTLLILPEATGQDIFPHTDDRREGWEWGHSKVLTIVRDDATAEGFRAETKSYHVPTYNDVEAIRASMDLRKTLAKYGMSRGITITSEAWKNALEDAPLPVKVNGRVRKAKTENKHVASKTKQGFVKRLLGV